MRMWIVGPPGGGKTALLSRLRGYLAGRSVFCGDLDREGARLGAAPEGDFAIALPDAEDAEGAGRRATDRLVYVDRAAHHGRSAAPPVGADVWLCPEGEEALGGDFEAAFLRDELGGLGGTLTLLPGLFSAEVPALAVAQFVDRRLRWGVRYLELRDDLLDDVQLASAAALVPAGRRLVSVRRPRSLSDGRTWAALCAAADSAALWDWPVELGPRPELGIATPRVASLHTRHPGEPLEGTIARLSAAGEDAALLKLAVPVHDLGELYCGHAWARRAPGRHQFLPVSADGSGRWTWYRLWRGAGQPLNFLRETAAAGTAPSPDQPTLYEWLVRHEAPIAADGGPPFAALLGDPVAHSRTPAEQRVYFRRFGWPVFLIAVTEADLKACAPLEVLAALGLRAAAVTAPRKHDGRAWLEQAGGRFVASDARDPTEVCNTLGRAADGSWAGTNTDGIGLRSGWQALGAEDASLVGARVALWGGGGTGALLRSAFPDGVAFAARSGTARGGELAPGWTPEVVVWAVGRSRQPGCTWPPAGWQPRVVFDLNYSDDSPGREYAARCGARYESGLRFFRAQAVAQRRFWERALTDGFAAPS